MLPCQDHYPANERLCMSILIDDIVLSPSSQAIDVFIVSPHTSRALPVSAKNPGRAMIGIKALKTSRYTILCNYIHVKLHLLGLDTHNSLAKPAQAVLALLASHFARY